MADRAADIRRERPTRGSSRRGPSPAQSASGSAAGRTSRSRCEARCASPSGARMSGFEAVACTRLMPPMCDTEISRQAELRLPSQARHFERRRRTERLPVVDEQRPLAVGFGQQGQQRVDVLPRQIDDRQTESSSPAVRQLLVPAEVVRELARKIETLLGEPHLDGCRRRATSRPRSSPPIAAASPSSFQGLAGCAECLIRQMPLSLIRKNDVACALSGLLADPAEHVDERRAELVARHPGLSAGPSCMTGAGQTGRDDEHRLFERAERRRRVRAGVAESARTRSRCPARTRRVRRSVSADISGYCNRSASRDVRHEDSGSRRRPRSSDPAARLRPVEAIELARRSSG